MLNISVVLSQVRVEYTPDRGRHLRAARALQLGEVSFPILFKTGGLCNMQTCEGLVSVQLVELNNVVVQVIQVMRRCKDVHFVTGGCSGGASRPFSSDPGLA